MFIKQDKPVFKYRQPNQGGLGCYVIFPCDKNDIYMWKFVMQEFRNKGVFCKPHSKKLFLDQHIGWDYWLD